MYQIILYTEHHLVVNKFAFFVTYQCTNWKRGTVIGYIHHTYIYNHYNQSH